MRCCRLFVAYSYRLSRRHSNFLLATILVATLTIIFQLYSQRHHNYRHTYSLVGDFDYRPGSFLTDRQPGNISYCKFNYGLPNYLNWSNIKVHPSPEGGIHGPYRVIYNAIKGTAYERLGKYKAVTYVTQATPEFLYHIVEIARYWDGPISLSVFVPDYDLDITIQIMTQLCQCYSRMDQVSLHLFYDKNTPPKLSRAPATTPIATTISNITFEEILKKKIDNYKTLNNSARAVYIQNSIKKRINHMMSKVVSRSSAPFLSFDDCSGLDSYDLPTYRQQKNLLYPINVGRNAARNASRTNYFLVSDIEFVPSDYLASGFLSMLTKVLGKLKRYKGCIISKTVFVVPVFEVERGEPIPRNKRKLVELVAENRATYFHQKSCTHCQRFPGLQEWISRSNTEKVEAMTITKRENPFHRWEPLYFGTNKEPWYSEKLSWEGQQDKMTQMLELCLQNYNLVVLDGGFLCHAARAATKSIHKHASAQFTNLIQYKSIVKNMKIKYKVKKECEIDWGLKLKS